MAAFSFPPSSPPLLGQVETEAFSPSFPSSDREIQCLSKRGEGRAAGFLRGPVCPSFFFPL